MLQRIRKIDGRWFLGGSHLALLIVSILFFNLARSWFQIFSGCLAAVAVELLWRRFSHRRKDRSIFDVAASACTEAFGILILIHSNFDYAYMLMSALAVSSKYLFVLDNRRHVFNPTNFAIIALLVFVPIEAIEIRSDEFSLTFYAIGHVLVFGILAVIAGGTWRVALSYFITILLVSAFQASVSNESWIYFFGPEIGASGLIFMLMMITDPKTSPRSGQLQILFGISIGVLLYVFRAFEFFYAHFVAMFVVSLLRAICILFELDKAWEAGWGSLKKVSSYTGSH